MAAVRTARSWHGPVCGCPASGGLCRAVPHVDLFEMAAAYLFHLAMNHPFVDGNKRTALAACLVFLDLNGIELDADPDELEDLTVSVAQGNIDKSALAQTLRRMTE